jgi:hypothetical protein
MKIRTAAVLFGLLLFAGVGLPAATPTFPVAELKPGMIGVGRTVFQGDRLEDFKVHILGVLRNVIGTRRNLILARLEGGPLAETGVIAGMSGSPVYIDGRLVGAVSYSLGQFSKEPIAGITPIDEMTQDASLPVTRRAAAPIALAMPVTAEGMRASLRQAFSWIRPFAEQPSDIQAFGPGIDAGIATMLRPIATPLTIGGFDASVVDPLASAFREQGFLPMMAGGGQDVRPATQQPLRPGDPLGVALVTGDLEFGATGTVTEVDGDRVYAFGHPFFGLGPTQFPMTRAYVHTILPSLLSSSKLASTGETIGTVQQDRATAIAGTLGPGPTLIPITLRLTSDRSATKTFKMSIVNDQLFTPLLTYVSILNTLSSYERQNGAASYVVRGSASIKKYGTVNFEDLFTGDTPSIGAAAYVVGPINFLLRNAFEDVAIEGLDLEIEASEQSKSATLERVWIDGPRPKPGSTVTVKASIRTYRGEEITRSVPVVIPENARGSVSIMVTDGTRLSQVEARELQTPPLQTRDLPQMLRVLNQTRKNNRLYVRLLSSDAGAVVRGEALSSLPPSVLAVMESDRNGGSFRSLQAALLGQWEIQTDNAVTGVRTLTLSLDN